MPERCAFQASFGRKMAKIVSQDKKRSQLCLCICSVTLLQMLCASLRLTPCLFTSNAAFWPNPFTQCTIRFFSEDKNGRVLNEENRKSTLISLASKTIIHQSRHDVGHLTRSLSLSTRQSATQFGFSSACTRQSGKYHLPFLWSLTIFRMGNKSIFGIEMYGVGAYQAT